MVTMGRRALWRRWVALVTLGEVTGFAVPAVAGIWAAQRPRRERSSWSCTAAGLFEGAMLGLAQAAVLHRAWRIPARGLGRGDEPRRRGWPGSSACSRQPPTTRGRRGPWAGSSQRRAFSAAALLGTIGTAQALVLPREHVVRSRVGGVDGVGLVRRARRLHRGGTTLVAPGSVVLVGLLVGLAGGLAWPSPWPPSPGVGAVRLVAASARSTPIRRGRQFVLSPRWAPPCTTAPAIGSERSTTSSPTWPSSSTRPRVTTLVIRSARGQRTVVPWRSVTAPPASGPVGDRVSSRTPSRTPASGPRAPRPA